MRDPNNEINTAQFVNIEGLAVGSGSYNVLLGINILGACLSMGTFWLFAFENRTGENISREPIWVGPGYSRAIDAYTMALQGKFEIVGGVIDENLDDCADGNEKVCLDHEILSPCTDLICNLPYPRSDRHLT